MTWLLNLYQWWEPDLIGDRWYDLWDKSWKTAKKRYPRLNLWHWLYII